MSVCVCVCVCVAALAAGPRGTALVLVVVDVVKPEVNDAMTHHALWTHNTQLECKNESTHTHTHARTHKYVHFWDPRRTYYKRQEVGYRQLKRPDSNKKILSHNSNNIIVMIISLLKINTIAAYKVIGTILHNYTISLVLMYCIIIIIIMLLGI